tara:strand:+ start:1075 stop:2202 length:1128 start_codon:yes stop_codon:yes gene_type:complete
MTNPNLIIGDLIENNCIKIGSFKLKSGEISKYYFDMKNIVSYPNIVRNIGDLMYQIINKEECDIICGVPIGGLPVCSYISTKYDIPMIMVRDEVKTYGTNKQIEGTYKPTDKCIIIEDVITSGQSVQKVIDILKDKVNVVGVVVIIDRQQSYTCSLPVNSLITKTDIVRFKLSKIIKEKNSRLCFSADIGDTNKLLEIVNNIGKYIVICKIHYDFYQENEEFKQKLIESSIKHNFLIMEDRKFVDISYTVQKQYKKYCNWVDMITVMGNVNSSVVEGLSGVLLVANMSNNNFDYTNQATQLSKNYKKNIIGFITQKRIQEPEMLCMTPGINIKKKSDKDQNYRTVDDVDTDIIIVGRGIYQNDDYIKECQKYSIL